jgi:Methyltransferase domain
MAPAVPNFNNHKAQAWDTIGAAYWNAGYNGGPTGRDIDQYLLDAGPHTRAIIIGASTITLIKATIERCGEVTVLDFSERMCAALASTVDTDRCHIVHHDITTPLPASLARRFDVVLADRLINRFTETEILAALGEMLRLLKDGGEIRTAIRLGLYRRDLPLLEEGRRRGTTGEFFDEATWTIDYGRLGDILEILPAHGQIPRDVLLDFYRLRGAEKRLREEDVRRYTEAVRDEDRYLIVADAERFFETTDQTLFRFRVVPRSDGAPTEKRQPDPADD